MLHKKRRGKLQILEKDFCLTYLKSGFLLDRYLKSGFLLDKYLKSGFLLDRYLKSGFLLDRYLKSGFLLDRYLKSGFLPKPIKYGWHEDQMGKKEKILTEIMYIYMVSLDGAVLNVLGCCAVRLINTYIISSMVYII